MVLVDTEYEGSEPESGSEDEDAENAGPEIAADKFEDDVNVDPWRNHFIYVDEDEDINDEAEEVDEDAQEKELGELRTMALFTTSGVANDVPATTYDVSIPIPHVADEDDIREYLYLPTMACHNMHWPISASRTLWQRTLDFLGVERPEPIPEIVDDKLYIPFAGLIPFQLPKPTHREYKMDRFHEYRDYDYPEVVTLHAGMTIEEAWGLSKEGKTFEL